MSNEQIQLTSTELELMTILWQLRKANVREIMAELPEGRDLAYTSVSTIIRILEKKGIVQAHKEGRGHSYSPLIEKKSFEKASVTDLVQNVFQGASLSLVKTLIESEKLSQQDLDQLRELLKEEK